MKRQKIIKKQEAEQAIPPTAPSFIAEAIEDARKVEREPLPDEDEILAKGAESDFWKILKRYIQDKIKGLRELTTQAVVKAGFRLEEAGFRYVLTDQICHALEDVVGYVEFRRETIEKMKREEAKRREVKK